MTLTFCRLWQGCPKTKDIFEANQFITSMKRSGQDFVEPRDEAFYREYKKALAGKGVVTHMEAINIALRAPQPRMWVTFYGVYRMLLHIVYQSRKKPKAAARQGLEKEVAAKYRILRNQRAFKDASLFFLTSFIISEPSVGFYISPTHAQRIVWRMRKKHQMRWKKEHSKPTPPQDSCSSCAR